jgi:hypothetical protein
MISVPEDSNLWEWSIPRLEFFIKLGNKMIKWMMSDDPMLKQDEYRSLVAPAKERLGNEVRQMIIVCRAKKMERDSLESEFVENVKIGLQTGRINVRKIR